MESEKNFVINIIDILVTFLDRHDSVDSLECYWLKNKVIINKIKKLYPSEYEMLVNEFKTQKRKILNEKKT